MDVPINRVPVVPRRSGTSRRRCWIARSDSSPVTGVHHAVRAPAPLELTEPHLPCPAQPPSPALCRAEVRNTAGHSSLWQGWTPWCTQSTPKPQCVKTRAAPATVPAPALPCRRPALRQLPGPSSRHTAAFHPPGQTHRQGRDEGLCCPSSRQQHKSTECKVCVLLFFCLFNCTKSNKNILHSGECLAKQTHQKAQTQNYSHNR